MRARSKKIAIIATLDSKGAEVGFITSALHESGRETIVIDVGTAGTPAYPADIPRETVASRGDQLLSGEDPAQALMGMAAGARVLLTELLECGEIGAVAGIGGGKGAGLFDQATRNLPFGFPKLLVSSARPALLGDIASRSDMILMPTLVDLFGLNRFTQTILTNAASALAGLDWSPMEAKPRQVVAITAFGVTTPAAKAIQNLLADAAIDSVVFPANGAGGRAMEALIEKGEFDGVVDLTTTEMADYLLGGTASAGEQRLTAAGAAGIPQVIAPGAVDMVNFGPPDTVPAKFANRTTYRHTPLTTLVRTTPEETEKIGRLTAERLNTAKAPVLILWPEHGVSDYDREGRPFYDPAANAAWLRGLQATLNDRIALRKLAMHINDPAFARQCAAWMTDQLKDQS